MFCLKKSEINIHSDHFIIHLIKYRVNEIILNNLYDIVTNAVFMSEQPHETEYILQIINKYIF